VNVHPTAPGYGRGHLPPETDVHNLPHGCHHLPGDSDPSDWDDACSAASAWNEAADYLERTGDCGPLEAAEASAHLAAKTRYRQQDAACTLGAPEGAEGRIALEFEQAQWAVTPGQSAVLYAGEVCLGGGVIEEAA
jgi:hypothetical protein